jgi:hypothetical protein
MALAERDRKALQWGGAAVVGFLLLRFAIFPAWDHLSAGSQDLVLRETALAKYRQAVQAASLHEQATQSLESQRRAAEQGLLQSETAALASAELQEWVKQLTVSRGIEVRSSDFLKVQPAEHGYAQVPLGLQFECRLDQLVSLLAELQGGQKILTLPRLVIQSVQGEGKLLNVTMTVAGWMRSRGEGAAAPR